MSWFIRTLRGGKEYAACPAPDPNRAQAQPEPAASSFDFGAALQDAENATLEYVFQRIEEDGPSSEDARSLPPTRANSTTPSEATTSPVPAALKRSSSPSMEVQGAPVKKRKWKHVKRTLQREAAREALGHIPAPGSTSQLLSTSTSGPIETPLITSDLPAARGGYFAKPGKPDIDFNRRYTLDELKALGLRYITWDGVTPIPIYDSEGRIIAVLAGRPKEQGYLDAADSAFVFLRDSGRNEVWSDKELAAHRRGAFIAHNVGITVGKGVGRPSRLRAHALLNELILGNVSVQRLAIFQSAAFQRWSPQLFAYYKEHMDRLHAHEPHLGGPNFLRSVFACAAFNLSVDSWSYKHRDSANLPFGWCAITALANKGFRPHLGGQIILWELGMVVEFPHGSSILIPSATITHSNVPPAEGDERLSFTQFTAGALFRYVDNGFRTDKQVFGRNRKEFRRLDALKETRWEKGVSLYARLEELLDYVPQAQ